MAAKNIVLTHEGKKYTLEFNRRTVGMLERQGFNPDSLETMPLSTISMLVRGAFMMHHNYIDDNLVMDIYKTVKDKNNFLAKLLEMYTDTVTSLMDEPEESEGNANWEASW